MAANPVEEAAYEAVELETWGSEHLADFQQTFNKLHNLLMKKGKKLPISYQTNAGGVTRLPMRVPFRPQGGAAISQLAAESAGSIPYFTRGTGSQTDGFVAGPVILVNTCEISNLAQWATDTKDRGLVKVQKEEMEHSLRAFNNGIEGLFNGDGSGTIDSIPTTATINNNTGSGQSTSSIIGLNTAAGFADQQSVQVLSAIGGTNRGSFTISYTDPVTQTIFSSGALPSGTTNGDILVVAGASGAAGSSVYGYRYWNVNGNTGTVAGINKALYPSRLSTPTINLNNSGAVTPALAGRIEVLISRARGDEYDEEEDEFYYCNPVQTYGMSQDFYNRGYTRLDENNGKGDEVPDTARKFLQKSYGGYDLHTSNTAQPTRIDRFATKDWIVGELMETRLHDWGGGNVIAPVPAIGQTTSTNATYYNSIMFAYETGLQLVCQDPKDQMYVQQAPVATI
jgi:hypothetical protein